MGIIEMAIGLAGLALTGLTVGGAAVKALWAISSNLGKYQATVAKTLESHAKQLDDHEDRLREGNL